MDMESSAKPWKDIKNNRRKRVKKVSGETCCSRSIWKTAVKIKMIAMMGWISL